MVRRTPVVTRRPPPRRQPLKERRGVQVARERLLPAPVGGWNARDALSAMRETDAVFLRNWFPQQSSLISRPGFSEHADTGTGAAVSTLIPFEYGSHSKLLAASSGGMYDVTTSTVSTLATGLSGNEWSFDYIGGYVLMCNGADVVKSYDGSTFANPAFTGVTLTTLNHVSVYKSRAYFVEADTQSMWYGGVGAVSGALTEFNFATVASIEGNLVFTSHLKGDGGDGGQDDLFVAVFAGGDALVYTGSNPGDANDWSILGHYKIGRPLSRFSYTRADDDLYVITNRGYEQLSQVVKTGRSTPDELLLSRRIQNAVTDEIKSIGADSGWRLTIYPRGQMLIVTVPSSVRRYHVQNINTGRWCEFRDFSAFTWGVWAGDAYFGHLTDGKVYAFDDGSITDDGDTIRCDAQPAWTDLGFGSRNKEIQLLRPYFFATYFPALSINVAADYDTITLSAFSSAIVSGTIIWDNVSWDEVSWPQISSTRKRWFSRNALGAKIGLRLTVDVNSTGGQIEWNNTQLIFTVGGYT